MSEKLGEAVLVLRTDDSQLGPGMAKARTGAEGVGMAFDKTSGSGDRLTNTFKATGTAATASGNQMVTAAQKVTAANGSQRAGIQQLTMNIGDMSTMYALGARPAQIFASQIGQITQAIQLAAGGTSKFATFLGGPWGIAVILAVQVLGPFIGKLFETASAADEVKKRLSEAADGADAFGDAQSLLGKMVDLTTGKLKSHNDVLRATIWLQATLSKQQAEEEGRTAKKLLLTEATRSTGGFGAITPGGTAIGQASDVRLQYPELSLALTGVIAKGVTPIDAQRQVQALAAAGKAPKNVNEILSSIVEYSQARDKGEANDAILKYLDTGQIDPRLVPYEKPKKPTKGPKDQSEQRLERFQSELAALQDTQLQLNEQLTADVRLRAGISHQRITNETEAYKLELESRVRQGELTAARAKALLTAREANAEDEHALVNRRLDAELREGELAIARDALAARMTVFQGELDFARTQAERRRIQLAMLDAETDNLKASLEAELLSKDLNEADRAILEARLGRVGADRDRRAASIERQSAGPWDQWVTSLPRDIAELDEAFQNAAANGMNDFNRGLAEAMANAESFADVFNQVKRRFVADLIEMGLRWAESQIFKTGGSGGGGGFLGSILGAFGLGGGGFGGDVKAGLGGLKGSFAPGETGGTPDSLLSMFGLGLPSFGGGRAGGGPVSPGSYYAVNERSTAPGLFLPLSPGIIEPPSAGYGAPDHGAAAGRVSLEITLLDDLLDARVRSASAEVAVEVVRGAAPTLVDAAAAETTRRMTRPRI